MAAPSRSVNSDNSQHSAIIRACDPSPDWLNPKEQPTRYIRSIRKLQDTYKRREMSATYGTDTKVEISYKTEQIQLVFKMEIPNVLFPLLNEATKLKQISSVL